MRKSKFLILILIIILSNYFLNPTSLIVTKKIAKIGDEIILKDEVDMIADKNKISFDEALKQAIDSTLLYIAAKIYIPMPTNEQLDMVIKKQKSYLASLSGVEVNKITDEDFLRYLHYNNITLETYKKYLKKIIWIESYVDKKMETEKYKVSNITDQEVKEFISKNPEMFLEKEGVLLSIIYFSYYKKDQSKLPKEEIELVVKKSAVCIKELQSGESFEDMVEKYSDDLISKNADPKGRVGYIFLDDPKISDSFNKEIIEVFKNADIGIIHKTFETKNGLYLFNIEEKIKPVKLSQEESEIKAKDFIKRKNLNKLEDIVIQNIIKETKEKVNVILY